MPVNKKQTSKRVAKIDSKLLKNKKSPKKVKTAAASGLAQAPLHTKKAAKKSPRKTPKPLKG